MKIVKTCLLVSLLLLAAACAKEKVIAVLDDISRDTYEKQARKQRIENQVNAAPYEKEPLSYEQYQRERREVIAEHEATP